MFAARTSMPDWAVEVCFVDVASLIASSTSLLITAVPTDDAPKLSVARSAVRR